MDTPETVDNVAIAIEFLNWFFTLQYVKVALGVLGGWLVSAGWRWLRTPSVTAEPSHSLHGKEIFDLLSAPEDQANPKTLWGVSQGYIKRGLVSIDPKTGNVYRYDAAASALSVVPSSKFHKWEIKAIKAKAKVINDRLLKDAVDQSDLNDINAFRNASRGI